MFSVVLAAMAGRLTAGACAAALRRALLLSVWLLRAEFQPAQEGVVLSSCRSDLPHGDVAAHHDAQTKRAVFRDHSGDERSMDAARFMCGNAVAVLDEHHGASNVATASGVSVNTRPSSEGLTVTERMYTLLRKISSTGATSDEQSFIRENLHQDVGHDSSFLSYNMFENLAVPPQGGTDDAEPGECDSMPLRGNAPRSAGRLVPPQAHRLITQVTSSCYHMFFLGADTHWTSGALWPAIAIGLLGLVAFIMWISFYHPIEAAPSSTPQTTWASWSTRTRPSKNR